MNERTPAVDVDVQNLDFDAVYRGVSPIPGMALDRVPWDLREPQEAVRDLHTSGRVSGHVLDAGCGFGENATYLAEQGYEVTGVDGAPTAIRLARERAEALGVRVSFEVADLTDLEGYAGAFDTVVDSLTYHSMAPEPAARYAAALHRATRPGALLSIICVPETAPTGTPIPFPVSEASLDAALTPGWTVTAIRPTTTAAVMSAAVLERIGAPYEPDEQGRVYFGGWIVEAGRNP